MKLYRIRLWTNECRGSYQTFHAKALSEAEALEKAKMQVEKIGQTFSSVMEICAY
jgi:hypothetical protein